MKKVILFASCWLVVVCTACQSDRADYTPYVQFSGFYVNPTFSGDSIVSASDTLVPRAEDDYYVLDTILTSDTIVFAAGFGAWANDLMAARVLFDTVQLNMRAQLSESLQSILLAESEVDLLQLKIKPGYSSIAFPIGYKPKQTGCFKMEFIVESDSKFSPRSVVIYQPVKAAP